MNNKNPLVSVMVPVYKRHHDAIFCIKSIICQSYCNLEVIVSDDSPTPVLGELLASQINDTRIRYSHNTKRLGRVQNYQHMLYNLVTGEWCINVDGDDYISNPNFIQKCIEAINKNQNVDRLSLVFADEFELVESTNTLKKRISRLKSGQVFPPGELFYENTRIGASFYHLSSVLNVRAARLAGAYKDDCLGTDTLAIYRTIYNNSCIYLNIDGGTWRNHGNNESFNTSLEVLEKNLHSVRDLTNDLFINGTGSPTPRQVAWYKTQIKSRVYRYLMHIRCTRDLLSKLPTIYRLTLQHHITSAQFLLLLTKAAISRFKNAFFA